MKKKINVIVITGGVSNERDISLMSGSQVSSHLDKKKYAVTSIDVSQNGWNILNQAKGSNKKVNRKQLVPIATSNVAITEKFKNTDVVFLALHGKLGEDGRMQSFFEMLGIPYTGSGVLASALAMDKARTQAVVSSLGICTIPSVLLFKKDLENKQELIKKIKKTCGFPCFIKPNQSGSSVGAGIAKTVTELEKRLKDAFYHDSEVLVQKYIKGRELTCAVIGNSGDTVKALPPVEIRTTAEFFDREVKYSSETIELCPAPLTKAQTKKIGELAVMAHTALGCDGVTRSDFILSGSTFYYLETNTIPGLTENSLAPKEARAAGMSFAKYLDTQVMLALKKKK